MARFPEGAFDPSASDLPWTKLATISEHLDADETIPPFLARWLSGAITQAAGDPNAFVIALGLRNRQGRPSAWDRPQSKEALSRLWALVSDGVPDDIAIERVRGEFMTNDGEDNFSRATLQRWLADVRHAENVARDTEAE
jgi:hypothetical protein